MIRYAETETVCPLCTAGAPAWYELLADRVLLHVECRLHGRLTEQAESDPDFFCRGYEEDYRRPHEHLVLPVTYRCNMACRYCYTTSNAATGGHLPEERSRARLLELVGDFHGNVTLLGGEPTVRADLPELVAAMRSMPGIGRVSVGTNGLRISERPYLGALKDAGLDFVFLAMNRAEYDGAGRGAYAAKLKALENCAALGVPVWLERTVDDLSQLDDLAALVTAHSRAIFNITIRSVTPFGLASPARKVFASGMIKYLGAPNEWSKGTSPFNRFIRFRGKRTKVCCWTNDLGRIDPVDSSYVTSDDVRTTLHRGIKADEALLMDRIFKARPGAVQPGLAVGHARTTSR